MYEGRLSHRFVFPFSAGISETADASGQCPGEASRNPDAPYAKEGDAGKWSCKADPSNYFDNSISHGVERIPCAV